MPPAQEWRKGGGRICAGRNADGASAYRTARRAQIVTTMALHDLLHRGAGMNAYAKGSRHAQITERQLGRMNAGAERLVNGTDSFGIIDKLAPQLLGRHHARATSRPQRAIHCERDNRPAAFCAWPPLRVLQPQATRFASRMVALMPNSRARKIAHDSPV